MDSHFLHDSFLLIPPALQGRSCKTRISHDGMRVFKHPARSFFILLFFLIFVYPEGLRYLSKGQDSSKSSFPLQIVALGGGALKSWHRYPTGARFTFTCCFVLFDSSPKSQTEAAERGGRAQQRCAGAPHELNHPVITIRAGVHHSRVVHTHTPAWPVFLSAD